MWKTTPLHTYNTEGVHKRCEMAEECMCRCIHTCIRTHTHIRPDNVNQTTQTCTHTWNTLGHPNERIICGESDRPTIEPINLQVRECMIVSVSAGRLPHSHTLLAWQAGMKMAEHNGPSVQTSRWLK